MRRGKAEVRHFALEPGNSAGYGGAMFLQGYDPRNFREAYEAWGHDLALFLTNETNLARAETASELGRPAVQPLATPILERFGATAENQRFRQLVGHMLRHIMEARGWALDQTEVRIPGGPLFTRAARYRRVGSQAREASATHHCDATASFFAYFWRRFEVASSLPATFGQVGDELTPDQHILVGAGLDALAKHWADSCGGPDKHRMRMAEFLALHGGHPCFERVAGPYLVRHSLNRAKKKAETDPAFQDPWSEPLRRSSGVRPTGRKVCLWEEDRDVAETLSHPDVDAANVPREWVKMHQYGGMLYVGHRCSWIHDSDEGLVTDRSFSDCDEPHYVSRNGRRVLVFPGAFLLRTYANAIRSFEDYCCVHSIVPAS